MREGGVIFCAILNIPLHCMIDSFKTSPSSLHVRRRRFQPLDAPPRLLIASGPFPLDVAEGVLDLVDRLGVARVLAHVVADLDRRAARGGGDFDHDVEGCGFLTAGGMGEVVCGRVSWVYGEWIAYWSRRFRCRKWGRSRRLRRPACI